MSDRPPLPTRRAVLAALATAPLAACVATAETPAPTIARFRAVRVDTAPFAAKGVSNYAARVGDRLRRAVAEVFAGRLAPNDPTAPTLVLEVSTVMLASWVGGRGSDDTMTGTLVLLSPKGTVITRRRHAVTSDAASAGPWQLPDNEARRLDTLCRVYAIWAVKEFGG
jgi:hypothetical protein